MIINKSNKKTAVASTATVVDRVIPAIPRAIVGSILYFIIIYTYISMYCSNIVYLRGVCAPPPPTDEGWRTPRHRSFLALTTTTSPPRLPAKCMRTDLARSGRTLYHSATIVWRTRPRRGVYYRVCGAQVKKNKTFKSIRARVFPLCPRLD